MRATNGRVMRLLAVLAVLAAPASTARAQDALVLSGGGARGIAHAGVLLALEERGHSPELVVGTSMGAIVGALYASGLPADSIAALLVRQDWRAIFAPDVLTVGPERTSVRPLLSFGVGDDAALFGGLVPDAGINRRLVELFFDAGARARSDFDRLPRRFRAIAADLRDGAAVPLRDGDLARATRASMAVPGVFSPILIDGRTLVDGGIADNLPVQQARKLGASNIIASDVFTPYLEPVPTSRVAIGIRAIRILIENAAPEGAPPDVLVTPRIPPEMSEAMFPMNARPLLDAGRSAALVVIPERAPAPPRPAPAPLNRLADTVVVEGVGTALEPLIRATFDAVVGGDYDAQQVLRRVTGLYATGMFRGVWPRVEDRAGSPTLIVHAEPVPASILTLAARVDDRRRAHGLLTLRQRVRFLGAGELRASVQGHRYLRLGALELSRPLAPRPELAPAAGAHYIERHVARFLGDTAAARVVRIGGWVGADWRSAAGRRVASLQWLFENVEAPGSEGYSTGPTFRWTETPAYPLVVGVTQKIDAGIRFGDVAYARLHARGGLRREIGGFRAALVADAAATDDDAPPDARFALGELDALPWLETGALRGIRRVIVGVDVAYPIFLDGAVRARLRAGASGASVRDLETGNAWRTGAELGAIWPTPFGALAGGFAFGDRGETRFTIAFGSDF